MFSTHEPLSANAFLHGAEISEISIDRDHCNRSNARYHIHEAVPIKTRQSAKRYFLLHRSFGSPASAMRPTTIVAHLPVITFLCAPRLQHVSSFVFGSSSGCSSSTTIGTCHARSRTKYHPNKCTNDLLFDSRRVDSEVHEGLKVGCWGARSTRARTGPTTALYGRGTIDDDDNNESLKTSKDVDEEETITLDTSRSSRDVPNKVVKAPSVTRIGGRSTSPLPARTNGSSSGGIGGIFSVESVQKFVLPVVLLFVLLKALLGGVFVSPSPARSSFVYYQSSTYESRTVDVSGNVKTIRKKSVRSNMPLSDWQQMDGIGRRYVYVDESESSNRGGSRFGQDTQREIDSEVAESMRQARDMIRGMGFTDLSSLDYR